VISRNFVQASRACQAEAAKQMQVDLVWGEDGSVFVAFGNYAVSAFASDQQKLRAGLTGLPSRSCKAAKAGGAKRDRTADLLHAMQALSQLSYGPIQVVSAACAIRSEAEPIGSFLGLQVPK
jgi:hypothetical protein